MTVRLRPHHLLCILTHVGEGYSPAFTANLAVIIGRIGAGEDVVIVDGPDEICAPLLGGSEPHCHRKSVVARDRAAADDIGELLALPLEPGTRLSLDEAVIQRFRREFAAGRIRSACGGCDWTPLCSSVAEGGYTGAFL